MKTLNKISNILINLLIFVVSICLLLVIYNFFQINILKKSYTNYFGYTYFEILTGSMKEEIDIDDYVFVKITNDIKEGDIISFYYDSSVVTHRVIKMDEELIITKGDANNVNDAPIKKEDIIGKVVFIGRNYGKYIKVITEPIVFIPFFITIVLFNLAFSGKGKDISDEKV